MMHTVLICPDLSDVIMDDILSVDHYGSQPYCYLQKLTRPIVGGEYVMIVHLDKEAMVH